MTAAGQLPQPYAWFTHQADIARFTGKGDHCQHRRCRAPIEVVSRRWFRSGGHVLLAEHFWCGPHGREFAARHHLEIGPAPSEAELAEAGLPHLDPEPQTFLYGMSAAMLADHEANGWHCDWPRCRAEAQYFSAWHYQPPRGKFRRVTRFLCVPHARRFAAEHGIDFATVPPPEGDPR